MNCANQTVLCIGNNNNSCEPVTTMLKQIGYRVVFYSTAEEGLHYARKKRIRAIMLDNQIENRKKNKICREVRNFDTITPIIFFSGRRTGKAIDNEAKAQSVQAR